MSKLRRDLLRAVLVLAIVGIAMWLQGQDFAPAGGPATAGEEWTVTIVYDGDTLVAQRGGVEETVRFIGIDTPEIDDCGYSEARSALNDRVRGSVVTLVPGADTNRDRYDRLLRYVEIDGEDVGLALIESGLARARYDYRTGQPHDREGSYIAADAASADLCSGSGL